MSDIRYFTEEGLTKLKEELHTMQTKGRADMARQIAEARDKGDLSENAEYDAAKEAQGYLEARIAKLETDIANSRILDETKLDTSKVLILTKVKVRNLKFNKEFNYHIVSPNEANVREGRISVDSPIGKGLLGKSVGDIAEIQVPAGLVKMEILDISV